MVEAGELVIKARIDDRDLNLGTAGLRNMDNVAGNLGKTFAATGIAAAGLLTGIAVKSPVLSGTLSKMNVEMLKLSNTVAQNMKPIFDSVANELIPSINGAFERNSSNAVTLSDRIAGLVSALSDLISLDYAGFSANLDKALKPEGLAPLAAGQSEMTISSVDPYRETRQSYQNFMDYKRGPESMGLGYQAGRVSDLGLLALNAVVDTFQYLSSVKDKKDASMAMSNGVSRGA